MQWRKRRKCIFRTIVGTVHTVRLVAVVGMLCTHHCTAPQRCSVYQDRLGTKIGKTQKESEWRGCTNLSYTARPGLVRCWATSSSASHVLASSGIRPVAPTLQAENSERDTERKTERTESHRIRGPAPLSGCHRTLGHVCLSRSPLRCRQKTVSATQKAGQRGQRATEIRGPAPLAKMPRSFCPSP